MCIRDRSPAWGINVEDFWWYEQGYTFLYGESEGRAYQDNLRKRFGDFYLNLCVTLMEFGCPEALMGQILAPALLPVSYTHLGERAVITASWPFFCLWDMRFCACTISGRRRKNSIRCFGFWLSACWCSLRGNLSC